MVEAEYEKENPALARGVSNEDQNRRQECSGGAACDQAPPSERVLEDVFDFVGRFVCYPSKHAQIAHALWILHTHLMSAWETTPRLAFLSAEPGSGKSRALEVTDLLVPKPVSTVNGSPAYFFRKVASQEGVTLLLDEIDTIFGPKAREHEDLRGFLNAGHRRGATAGRCFMREGQVLTEDLPAYAAVAMAGIGSLPDTILSRSVVVRMRPRRPDEVIEQFRRRLHKEAASSLRSRIEDWAKSAKIEWPNFPPEIRDRDADVWEPLLAVADAFGGKWPSLARCAAIALTAAAKDTEPSLGIKLLIDLRPLFRDADRLFTETILAKLANLEESPWGDIGGKPLDARLLAKLLRPYGVKSGSLRIGEMTSKGYRRADLVDVWRCYCPSSPETCEMERARAVPEDPLEDAA